MEKERSVAIAIFVIIFVLAGFCLELVHGVLTPSCTVGVPGTAAKVTLQSFTAPGNCSKLVRSGNFYAVTVPIHEPAICGEHGFFMRYTVYAEGVLDREGETLCQTISALLASGCPLDDPDYTQRAILPLDQDEDVSQRTFCEDGEN